MSKQSEAFRRKNEARKEKKTTQPTLSSTLYVAADLAGKPSAAAASELRELGDIARGMEKQSAALLAACKGMLASFVASGEGEITECAQARAAIAFAEND